MARLDWLVEASAILTDECIPWPSDWATTHDGYGKIKLDGKTHRVHRVVWYIQTGRWPRYTLDHTCRNRLCFNMRHLEDVSRPENSRRSWDGRRRQT